ncbi:MAG: hypothetical protein ACRBB0_15280 [Pelagimonas sp.]|uniref:hypothetical protein n=1 Tax=Pelagimonas sp. TaxID=2073170 RepID=UPI003D6C2E90
MSRAKRRKGGRPRKAKISLPQFNGDHGTGTAAATHSTLVVPVKDSPNRVANRRRIDALDRIIARDILTMPEQQAAKAIRDAYSRTEALSSGGEMKEQVDSSPKPDASIAAQVDAMSHWAHVMAPIRTDRAIIEHVCCHGQPLRTLPTKYRRRSMARLRDQLIKVAVHLEYAHPQDVAKMVA